MQRRSRQQWKLCHAETSFGIWWWKHDVFLCWGETGIRSIHHATQTGHRWMGEWMESFCQFLKTQAMEFSIFVCWVYLPSLNYNPHCCKKTGQFRLLAASYQKQIVPTANCRPTSDCVYWLQVLLSFSSTFSILRPKQDYIHLLISATSRVCLCDPNK